MSHQEKVQTSHSTRLKNLFIYDDFKNSMASLTTNLFNLGALFLILMSTAYLSKVPASELQNNRVEIDLVYVICPPIAFIVFLLTHYIRHKPLRNAAFIQLRKLCGQIYEKIFVPKLLKDLI